MKNGQWSILVGIQVQTLEEELKQLESLREDLEAADVTIQQKQTDIAQLKDTVIFFLSLVYIFPFERGNICLAISPWRGRILHRKLGR